MNDLKRKRNIRRNRPKFNFKNNLKNAGLRKNLEIKNTGTCLGNCVICGALCCLDAGHPGPH